MKAKSWRVVLSGFVLMLVIWSAQATTIDFYGQYSAPMRLIQTIPMPNVSGRMLLLAGAELLLKSKGGKPLDLGSWNLDLSMNIGVP